MTNPASSSVPGYPDPDTMGDIALLLQRGDIPTNPMNQIPRINSQNQLVNKDGQAVGGVVATLVGAEKVRSMLAAIRTGSWQRVHLGFHGHSIIQGFASDDTANGDLAAAQAWRQRSIAATLSRALNGAVGGAWAGGVETAAPSQRLFFTLGGAASISGPYAPAGPGGHVITLTNATDTCTFTAAGTSVRAYCYASGAGVVARYTVNGGATVNVAAAPSAPTGFVASGNTLVWYEFTISGLTVGDTVQLLGPASGGASNNYRVHAVDLAHTTTAGITVHRLAVAGYMGSQTVAGYLDDTDTQPGNSEYWTAPGASAQRNMQTDSVTTRLALSGVFNMFDVNDMKAFNDVGNGTAWGWTLDKIGQNFQKYINSMAARNLPVIFCFGPLRDPNAASTAGTPFTQADLIERYKQIVKASSNCAYVDLTEEFSGPTLNARYAAQQATGLIFDTVHPNGRGSAYYGAQRIARAVLAS